jgi:hypothetical protein
MKFNQGGNQILRPYKNSQFKYCQRLPLPSFVLSCFLFYGMVRNRISRVCSYFSSTERNFELFSLPLKGSKGIPRILLLFLFHGTKFRVVFSSLEGFGTEFREFSVSVCNNHLFRLFRLPRNYFYVRNSQFAGFSERSKSRGSLEKTPKLADNVFCQHTKKNIT